MRSPITPTLDAITREIYGGLADQGHLDSCLRALSQAFRSHLCALHSENLGDHCGRLDVVGAVSASDFEALAGEYAVNWRGQNLWMERSTHGFRTKGYEVDEAVVGQQEFLASDFYRGFLRPLDVHHGAGICLWHDGDLNFAVASVNRSKRAGSFDGREIELLAALRPHLANVYSIYRRLRRAAGESSSFRATFDASPLGILMMDGEANVIEHNEAASRILGSGKGVHFASPLRLRFSQMAMQHSFREAFKAVASSAACPVTRTIMVSRSGAPASDGLVFHLCSLPSNGCAGSALRVLVFVSAAASRDCSAYASSMLQAALALTHSEAATLLALRAHGDPTAVAISMNLSITTVRTHLKNAFRKTGTGRQSELLNLAERVVASAPVH